MQSTGERLIPGLKNFSELEHLNRYYFVVNQIELKDKIVLDIASGEGYGSNILAKHALQVTGVDISLEAIEYATDKYRTKNLKFVHGDVTKIPMKDNSVDVVVSFETIEHHDKHFEMLQEIKRILRIDGVLIISSPDKYYYSDIPNYKNEFHVKELYNAEFKELISRNFIKTFFFNQRTFGGSIIALDENHNQYNPPLVVEQSGESNSFLPTYNIAIATDNLDYGIINQIVLYKEQDQVITKSDVDNAVEDALYHYELKLKKTKTWRIGHLLIFPFKLLKKIVEKQN